MTATGRKMKQPIQLTLRQCGAISSENDAAVHQTLGGFTHFTTQE